MGDVTDSSLTTPPPAPTPPPPPASSSAAPTPPSRPTPVREDCWSEDATATLIESWGRRYVELNRGNLRQKDWQDVADAVNALHGLTKKTHRTDVQCKNRIDTIKKKYKLEKARVSSNPSLSSSWTFFDRLDVLIGPSLSAKKPPPPSPSPSPSPPVAVPLLPYRKAIVALPQKRSAPTPPPVAASSDEGFFRRNYSAMAAAAAAAEVDDDEDEEFDAADEDEDEFEAAADEDEEGEEGMRRLAKAIAGFGEVYEKVEAEKLRHMVELEKQRMQFAKDLEVQRMRMFTDTQLQLERIKRAKRSSSNDIYG